MTSLRDPTGLWKGMQVSWFDIIKFIKNLIRDSEIFNRRSTNINLRHSPKSISIPWEKWKYFCYFILVLAKLKILSLISNLARTTRVIHRSLAFGRRQQPFIENCHPIDWCKVLLYLEVQMTSLKLMFIQLSQETRWPLYVSPFFNSTNIGWFWAVRSNDSGSISDFEKKKFIKSILWTMDKTWIKSK